ncbi:hypothetical protein PXH59_14525 [Xenorhabdus sp. SF857]|uniref:hypothetical protein n=1 Tax=Xenorhabdus bakwenae TaxID=3026967 RepID=UPI002557D76E|nr:hypothetical protein [Xenorhabdus sp. SF857]WFQ78856.1 hypothetical protein PXH59_14525 [Xenorhabdus sp. SF857]
MKNSTSLNRSKRQLTLMARLYDVFDDVKNEVEVTPEFIQETLVRFMQMATGNDYHVSKSARIGFGEVQSQPLVDVPEPVRAPLELNRTYYVPALCMKDSVTDELEWYGDEYDYLQLDRGLIHLDRESAEIHARALMSLASKNAAELKVPDEGNQLNDILSREMTLCLEDVLHRYAVWERVTPEKEALIISRTLHHAFSEYRKDNNHVIDGLPVFRKMISYGINWADDERSLKLLLEKNCLTIKKALNELFEGLIKQR